MHFILYSRLYCHLCDEMLSALQTFSSDYAFTVEVIDIDADQKLVEQYDELVPVLLGGKDGVTPIQLCHYFLDRDKLRLFLRNGAVS